MNLLSSTFLRALSLRLTVGGAAALLLLPAARGQDVIALTGDAPPSGGFWVDQVDLSTMQQDYGKPRAGRSVDDAPLTLGGVTYAHGIGSHANSELDLNLHGAASRFISMVGVDDEKKGHGSVTFQVWVDGKKAVETPVLHGGDPPQRVTVDLNGARRLALKVTDAGDGIDSDHADWAGAVVLARTPPEAMRAPTVQRTDIIFRESPVPAIHGPRIVGATPSRPFLFRVPATGRAPLRFSASLLPTGLTIDPATGIISGSIAYPGTADALISVTGPTGSASRTLRIVGAWNQLALTPPMGWNSWNVWAGAVSADKVRQAADLFIKTGLAAHGYQYVNIDDTWEGNRAPDGAITTNTKFPDMKALADYVHSQGLKLGIYSSPGPTTCGGFPASYQHEQQDADTYAAWGIDYLKYDWCSYADIAKNNSLEELQKPYRVMRQALDNTNRDIVFSLCQYGTGEVWKWGASVGGNCWRTTGDINDSWGSLDSIAFSQNGHEKYASPGHWNDPDMLVVGRVGWGDPHPSHLTPDEQLLHISMWCLQSAPLLIGCDLAQLDPFTLALLTNDEVNDIDQDPLGRPAGRVSQTGSLEVWARPLWDGSMAVGLFNRGVEPAFTTALWSDLGLTGSRSVRDLWHHRSLGRFRDRFTAIVPAHGVVLVRVQ